MKVITPEKNSFKFIPRISYLTASFILDSGVVVTNTVLNNIVTVTDVTKFTEGENYSFTIISNGITIYKGKLIFLKSGTDIQNYNAQTQDTKRWQ